MSAKAQPHNFIVYSHQIDPKKVPLSNIHDLFNHSKNKTHVQILSRVDGIEVIFCLSVNNYILIYVVFTINPV